MTILLFAGNRYYPGGGSYDLVGVFDSLEDAEAALTTVGPRYQSEDVWAEAYSLERRETVACWSGAAPCSLKPEDPAQRWKWTRTKAQQFDPLYADWAKRIN